jgi:hypothetical protein
VASNRTLDAPTIGRSYIDTLVLRRPMNLGGATQTRRLARSNDGLLARKLSGIHAENASLPRARQSNQPNHGQSQRDVPRCTRRVLRLPSSHCATSKRVHRPRIHVGSSAAAKRASTSGGSATGARRKSKSCDSCGMRTHGSSAQLFAEPARRDDPLRVAVTR